MVISILVIALAAAAVMDYRSRRIPNWLTLPVLLCALGLRALEGGSVLVDGLQGFGLAFALVVPLFAVGGVGGGDAKLLMAVGAFLGPQSFLLAALYSSLAGALMALFVVVRRGALLPALLNTRDLLAFGISLGRTGTRPETASPQVVRIPYGIAIAVGSIAALWMTPTGVFA